MRIWSIHPQYLDAQGLVAVWRETLLAQAVLSGNTIGYTQHPQLIRFKDCDDPVGAIGSYLSGIYEEACVRGYAFDRKKIARVNARIRLQVANGQVAYEFTHLLRKLKQRAPEYYADIKSVVKPKPHPLFRVVRGGIEDWEIVQSTRK